VAFNPVRMFNDQRAVHGSDSNASVHLPAVFWKWAGWKARERIRNLRNLVQRLRVHLPHLEFGMTLQSQSITNPVRGLIYFAEDWVDVARPMFDRFLITVEEPNSTVIHPASQNSSTEFSENNAEMASVVKMAQHLGKPEKIWAILPGRSAQARTSPDFLPQEVGFIYDRRGMP